MAKKITTKTSKPQPKYVKAVPTVGTISEYFAFYSRNRGDKASARGYQAFVTQKQPDGEITQKQVRIDEELAKNPKDKNLVALLKRATDTIANCVKNHRKAHEIVIDKGSNRPVGVQVNCRLERGGCGSGYFTCDKTGNTITDPPLTN